MKTILMSTDFFNTVHSQFYPRLTAGPRRFMQKKLCVVCGCVLCVVCVCPTVLLGVGGRVGGGLQRFGNVPNFYRFLVLIASLTTAHSATDSTRRIELE